MSAISQVRDACRDATKIGRAEWQFSRTRFDEALLHFTVDVQQHLSDQGPVERLPVQQALDCEAHERVALSDEVLHSLIAGRDVVLKRLVTGCHVVLQSVVTGTDEALQLVITKIDEVLQPICRGRAHGCEEHEAAGDSTDPGGLNGSALRDR
jgi:hypothetical protein